MLRTFRNSDGKTITVNRDHLEKAVEVKIQLQQLSPSNKCNWSKHILMMHEEGFSEADKTESYRLMVKNFQNDIGKLQKKKIKKGDNDIKKSSSIQNAVGDLYYQKRALQIEQNKLNKLKREVSQWSLVANEIRDVFLDELNLDLPQFVFKPKLPTSTNKLCLIVTDWHVGAVIHNCDGNYYNLNVLKKRLDVLKQKVLDYCYLYNVTEIEVVSLGDLCEHVYMRNTQSFDVEFDFSTQIVKATETLIELLVSLSHYVNVNFTGIAGNHDRMHGAVKNDNIDGDNAIRIINYAVQLFIQSSSIPRLTYTNPDELLYSCVKEINGKKLKFLHGDIEKKQDKNKLDKHISMDKETYDAIVHGHYHHYSVTERNKGALEIYFGSIMGRNNYSKKMKQVSDASQGILLITEEGDIYPNRIDLQVV